MDSYFIQLVIVHTVIKIWLFKFSQIWPMEPLSSWSSLLPDSIHTSQESSVYFLLT